MRKILLSLCSIFILNSCVEKVKDEEFPEPTGKLVVSCIISPEANKIAAGLSRTFPSGLTNKDSINNYLSEVDPLKNAIVYISDDRNKIKLPYSYTSSKAVVFSEKPDAYFRIRPGKSYRLDVFTEQGEYAWATCTVPDTINKSIEFRIPGEVVIKDKVHEGNEYFVYEIRQPEIHAVWEDLPGKQYYGIEASLINTNYYGSQVSSSYINFFPNDLIEDGGIFTAKEGKSYVTGTLHTEDSTDFKGKEGTYFVIDFYTGDENFGRYFRTLDDISYPGPFDEPLRQFTNINGGMGIFAACRTYQRTSYIGAGSPFY